ncbi:tryptophan halogenase [Arenicella chitinivorans]|uniref:Tryptophan halogenase n=1 Tax=Arenicella chitinivorans TaxID=1329800 RepID=A0A918RFI0_9GAMM|nr:tryptophan halogenase family protein [Arenicella chitinivorans]GGZ98041.1 tryptophan halogenase [Arenicella chitinivorans]
MSRVTRVLIVGGGTAGWITAGLLAKRFNCADDPTITVSLVESPNVPIMGVGEGTWPTIRTTLQVLGIDESEFIRCCDATFKQGSEFVNWVHTPEPGERHSYYHPLNAVFHAAYDFNLAPYWILGDGGDLPYDMATATQAQMCARNLAPKKITTPAYAAIQNYSYHLDANKFADFLHEHCVAHLGVQFHSADVNEVCLDEQGDIMAVETDQVGRLEADLFVDCSGAKAILLGEALGVPYQDISDIIFNDTALAIRVPYEDDQEPIATHTIATAFADGWTWDIGLTERRGVGFVYSSMYTDDAQAEEYLRAYLGEAGNQFEARKIRFQSGYRREFWHKNCVAIGMSAAFIEPLEASAIFLVEAAANMLAEQFPNTRKEMQYAADQYNSILNLRWDKTVDFVKLHYCVSKRRDSQYWIDNCDPKSIPESLQQRLAYWKTHVPSKYDFDYAFEPFVLDSYLFVLYGMQYEVDLRDSEHQFAQKRSARQRFDEVRRSVSTLETQLPTHRQLLEQVHKFGFAKI